MIDQLIIGDKASFDDFEASVASRAIKPPKKKSIKQTVPFSNVTYDFSAINGEVYWEERELEYVFELTAPTPEKLEELKASFAGWVMNVQGAELHDPHIPYHHFLATYEDLDVEDDEGMDKTTMRVMFTAYPYKIANTPTFSEVKLPQNKTVTVSVWNTSDHPVPLTLWAEYASASVHVVSPYWELYKAIEIGGAPSEATYPDALLPPGRTDLELTNVNLEYDVATRVGFVEEVL